MTFSLSWTRPPTAVMPTYTAKKITPPSVTVYISESEQVVVRSPILRMYFPTLRVYT